MKRYIINNNNGVKEIMNWEVLGECIEIHDTDLVSKANEIFCNDNLILSVGEKSYRTINELHKNKVIHIGLRSFDYGTITRLPVLNLGNCAIVFIQDKKEHWNFETGVRNFESLNWNDLRKYKLPEYKVYTVSDFMKVHESVLKSIDGTRIGFDYETAGFPNEHNFKATGFAMASHNATFFIDLRYYKDDAEYSEFKKVIADFLVKNQYNMWVYNVSFEYLATYREFGVQCYFNDVMALVKCDENWGSLKYVAQYYLKVASWDDDQDKYMDKLEQLFKLIPWEFNVDLYKKAMDKIAEECKEENYENYKLLMYLYSVGVDDSILKKYWGQPFACTPINIVSRYCCYDSFNTLLLADYLSNIYQIPLDQVWESDINNLYFK